MKKIFAFIMAVLVLSFSTMSCTDESSIELEVENYSQSKPDSEASHNDQCSPFCSCGCCAAFYFNHVVSLLMPLPLLLNKVDTNFLLAHILKLAFPFWQPPRSF